MKRTKDNLPHQIQLKQVEIANYEFIIRNYPPARMVRCGQPYLARLKDELNQLILASQEIINERQNQIS